MSSRRSCKPFKVYAYDPRGYGAHQCVFHYSERGNKETQLADVLSPVSKKKTGRAYVALARAHSEK